MFYNACVNFKRNDHALLCIKRNNKKELKSFAISQKTMKINKSRTTRISFKYIK